MMLLRMPWLPLLSLLCAAGAVLTVRGGRRWLGALTAGGIITMVLLALAGMLPLREVLLLLLVPLLACLAAAAEGRAP